jgi:hypothetical protein
LLALVILVAALRLPPPLSGRLHPAVVPLALSALALLAVGVAWLWRGPGNADACLPAEPSSWRSLLAAVLSLAFIAFGVRSLGLVPAAFAAAWVAVAGIAGVGVVRALLIAAALSVGAAGVFVLGLRQPWPLLPPALVGA